MDKIAELRATIELLRKKLIKEQHKALQATISLNFIAEEVKRYKKHYVGTEDIIEMLDNVIKEYKEDLNKADFLI